MHLLFSCTVATGLVYPFDPCTRTLADAGHVVACPALLPGALAGARGGGRA